MSDSGGDDAQGSKSANPVKLTPAVAAAAVAGVGAWMAAFFWLSAKTGWPHAYGYSCAGNGCLIFDAWHSPALLRRPTVYSVALFGWYWTMISAAVLLVLRAAAKRPRNVQIRAAAFFIIGIILSIVVHGWGSN